MTLYAHTFFDAKLRTFIIFSRANAEHADSVAISSFRSSLGYY